MEHSAAHEGNAGFKYRHISIWLLHVCPLLVHLQLFTCSEMLIFKLKHN